MAQRSLEKPFTNARECVGAALKMIRIHQGKRRKEFALALRRMPKYRHIDRSFVESVEDGNHLLSFWDFGKFCFALGCEPKRVLRIASFLKKKGGPPVTDEDVLAKIEYQIWEEEQGGK